MNEAKKREAVQRLLALIVAGSHFQISSPLGEINHFWNKIAFFRWFHVVPGVFGSFMSTRYMEPSWFPFSDFEPVW